MIYRNDGLEPGNRAFIERLVRDVPDLEEVLDRQREELGGDRREILEYVFLGAYVWPWFVERFRSASEADRAVAMKYIESLERELGAEDNDTRNLILVEFVEWLENPGNDDIRAALPTRLRRKLNAALESP